MVSSYVEMEQGIGQALAPLEAEGVKVIPFPDKPENIGRPQAASQIVYGFKQESFSVPQGKNIIYTTMTQTRRMEFEVLLQLKDLRSHTGVYAMMNRIRELLSGLRPDPKLDRVLYQLAAEPLSSSEGIWQFVMTFAVDLYYQKKNYA